MLGPYRLLWPVRAVVARMARKASFVRAYEQARGGDMEAVRHLAGGCSVKERPGRVFSLCIACVGQRCDEISATCGHVKIGRGCVRSYLQGIGRHSDADRRAMVAEELAALAALLGDKPYMFGDKCAHIALVACSAAPWCIASCPAADATAWAQPSLLPLPAFLSLGLQPTCSGCKCVRHTGPNGCGSHEPPAGCAGGSPPQPGALCASQLLQPMTCPGSLACGSDEV